MSRNYSQNNAASSAFAMIAVLLVFAAIAIYFILLTYTAILSILCLFALFSPLKIGKHVIEPETARWFLIRGILGWFLCPFAIITLAPFFDIKLQEDWIIWMMLTGYMIGSLGIEYVLEKLREQEREEEARRAQHAARQREMQAARQIPQAPQPPRPFHYASWDDEEEFRQ